MYKVYSLERTGESQEKQTKLKLKRDLSFKSTKSRASSLKRRKNSKSNKSTSSIRAKSKDQKIYASVQRVKDLTEKCLNDILNSSKISVKNPSKKSIKRHGSAYRATSVYKSKKSKWSKNLNKLEKMYKELMALS